MIRSDLARRVIHPSHAAHLNMVPHQDQQFAGPPPIPYPTPGPQPHLVPQPPLPQQPVGPVPFRPVITGTHGRSKDTAIAIDDDDDAPADAFPGLAGPPSGAGTNGKAPNGTSSGMDVDQVPSAPGPAPSAGTTGPTYAAVLAQPPSSASIPAPPSTQSLQSAAAPAQPAVPTPVDSPALAQAVLAQSQVANGTISPTAIMASPSRSAPRVGCPICGPTQPHTIQECSLYMAGPERLQGCVPSLISLLHFSLVTRNTY